MENKILGFRNFILFNQGKYLLSILSDLNPVSRIDSYITNWKMPWEKKEEKKTKEDEEPLFAVGRVELYKFSTNPKIKIDLFNALSYSSQAYCAYVSKNEKYLCVGCDNGTANVYTINASQQQFKTIFNDAVGEGRVQFCAVDSSRNYFYCFMKEGSLEIIDLARKEKMPSKINRFANIVLWNRKRDF